MCIRDRFCSVIFTALLLCLAGCDNVWDASKDLTIGQDWLEEAETDTADRLESDLFRDCLLYTSSALDAAGRAVRRMGGGATECDDGAGGKILVLDFEVLPRNGDRSWRAAIDGDVYKRQAISSLRAERRAENLSVIRPLAAAASMTP